MDSLKSFFESCFATDVICLLLLSLLAGDIVVSAGELEAGVGVTILLDVVDCCLLVVVVADTLVSTGASVFCPTKDFFVTSDTLVALSVSRWQTIIRATKIKKFCRLIKLVG